MDIEKLYASAIDRARETRLRQYESNMMAMKGSVCTCPVCRKEFVKKTYKHVFCTNKGSGNCKDRFWNSANDDRMVRTEVFSNKFHKRY